MTASFKLVRSLIFPLLGMVIAALASSAPFVALAQDGSIEDQFRPTIADNLKESGLQTEAIRKAEEAAEADLVAQQSMAKSTKELVDLTWYQVVIGTIESCLLIATTIGTVWAALAASRAAKSARDAVKIQIKSERPYVYAFGVYKLKRDRLLAGGFDPFADYKVANYGKTPAIIEKVAVGMCRKESEVNFVHTSGVPWLLRNPVLAPAECRELKQAIPDDVSTDGNTSPDEVLINDNEDLYMWIYLAYRGPFTTSHEMKRVWKLDQNNNRFYQLNQFSFDS